MRKDTGAGTFGMRGQFNRNVNAQFLYQLRDPRVGPTADVVELIERPDNSTANVAAIGGCQRNPDDLKAGSIVAFDWLEMREDPETKIARPRQIYTGDREVDYVPLDQR